VALGFGCSLCIHRSLNPKSLRLASSCAAHLCPRLPATYSGRSVAETTLVAKSLCSSIWMRPQCHFIMVGRRVWSSRVIIYLLIGSTKKSSCHMIHIASRCCPNMNSRGKLITWIWVPISGPRSGTQLGTMFSDSR
jgi:hypothetical protein